MKVNNVFVQVTTENPQALMTFYHEIVGIPKAEGMGDFALNAGGTTIGFDAHSEVSGSVKEPARILLDLFVDDIKAEQKRIEGHGVKFSRTEGREEWGGVISTFADPDGNLLQLIEYRPE